MSPGGCFKSLAPANEHIAARGGKGTIGQLDGLFKTGGGRRRKDQSHHDQSWINARGFHIDRQEETLF
jgi:hypothetical protein